MKSSIPILIYLGVLIYLLQYNLTHPLVNDGVFEYRGYLLDIKDGWQYRYSAINSVLVSIWLPAMIQRLTHWDAMILFRVFPPFFYALMPMFVYLIARRYFDVKYALASALVVIFSSYIFFFPDVGRVGVSLGIMAGMVWALLGKRIIWSALFATLLVFAHYGASIIAIGLVMAVIGGTFLIELRHLRNFYPQIKPYLITLACLVVFTGAWHFGFAHYSGDSMWNTMLRPDEARGILRNGDDGRPGIFVGSGEFLDLESRDKVTQAAFGLGFMDNPTPVKIEIIINWIVVGFVSLGLLIVLKNRIGDIRFRLMLIALYGLILATIAIPSFSFFYGTQRVYFTALIVLAACFPVGIVAVARKIRLSPTLIATGVLGAYALTTSGAIYPLFGMTKTLPVILRLP